MPHLATRKQTKVLRSADLLNSGNPLKMETSNTRDFELVNNMDFNHVEAEFRFFVQHVLTKSYFFSGTIKHFRVKLGKLVPNEISNKSVVGYHGEAKCHHIVS